MLQLADEWSRPSAFDTAAVTFDPVIEYRVLLIHFRNLVSAKHEFGDYRRIADSCTKQRQAYERATVLDVPI